MSRKVLFQIYMSKNKSCCIYNEMKIVLVVAYIISLMS